MSLKNRIVTVGFILFALTQFLISLPTAYGIADRLRPLTNVYEILGLKHRWSLFTHLPGDQRHAWYQVYHIVRISDALGAREEWQLPELPEDFFSRYSRAREIDYIKNIWMTKTYSALPLSRSHARMFLDKHPSAKFPLKAEIIQSFEKIREPLTLEAPGHPSLSVLHTLTIEEDERRCSARDTL